MVQQYYNIAQFSVENRFVFHEAPAEKIAVESGAGAVAVAVAVAVAGAAVADFEAAAPALPTR